MSDITLADLVTEAENRTLYTARYDRPKSTLEGWSNDEVLAALIDALRAQRETAEGLLESMFPPPPTPLELAHAEASRRVYLERMARENRDAERERRWNAHERPASYL